MQRHLALEEAQRRFLAYHEARNHSPKQLGHHRQTFCDFARFLAATRRKATVGALTSETFETFVAWLKVTPRRSYRGSTQRSIAGIHGHMKDLRAFVRWCADEERALIDWKVTVPMPKLPETFSPTLSEEELVRLFASRHLVGKSEYAVRNRAIIALLLDTGIRLGELASLTPDDLVANQGVRVMGKGNKERFVPYTSGVAAYVDDWLAIRAQLNPAADAPLFLLTYGGIEKLMQRITKDTGLAVFAHKFRHTAATHLVRRNVDLHTVRRILGHTQLSTTERYLSMSHVDLQAKHAVASPFASVMERMQQPPPRPERKRHRLSRRDVA